MTAGLKYIIVSNSYKRPVQLVERTLRASLNQKITPHCVILIDQNDTPLSLSKDITDHPLFRHQRTKEKAVSAARNALEVPAGTEWIFFCDDDGYPDVTYSEIMLDIISSDISLQILAGSILREDTGEYYSIRHRKGGSLKYFRNTKNLMGSNFIVRADVFDKLGRFDEHFGAGSFWGSSEETDFCWKAYFAEVKMEYYKDLVIFHVPPFNESVKSGFRKSFQYGVGKGALVWKWLFKHKKFIVIYELIEMIFVPVVQIIRGIITFKFQLAVNNLATISGRIYGLIKAGFVSPPNT